MDAVRCTADSSQHEYISSPLNRGALSPYRSHKTLLKLAALSYARKFL